MSLVLDYLTARIVEMVSQSLENQASKFDTFLSVLASHIASHIAIRQSSSELHHTWKNYKNSDKDKVETIVALLKSTKKLLADDFGLFMGIAREKKGVSLRNEKTCMMIERDGQQMKFSRRNKMIFIVWTILAYSKNSIYDNLLSFQGKQIVQCTRCISMLEWNVGPLDFDKSLAKIEGDDAEIKEEMRHEYEISSGGDGNWYLKKRCKNDI
jgi:hypothetical protein